MLVNNIKFPAYSGIRCLMMPYIQGDIDSLPTEYQPYYGVLSEVFINSGDIGYLTIDESPATKGVPHRGARAKYGRALHTEAGKREGIAGWGGGGGWGNSYNVTLDPDVQILVANNVDDSCAVWDASHADTSFDGDIGDKAAVYPYDNAILLKAGEVYQLGIFTPHESLPVKENVARQFLRIISSGIYGREEYFTVNPKLAVC